MARRTPVKASQRSKSPSPAPMLAGALVILIAAVAVIFIIGATEEPPPAAPPAEVVDPFAGIPDELPPGAKPGAPARDGADPFADVGQPSDAPPADPAALGAAWEEARALADEGLARVDRAARAKADGDHAGFKAAGADAKAKLEAALDRSRAVEEDLIREHGESHPDARAVQRERAKWRGELVALKKTVGL